MRRLLLLLATAAFADERLASPDAQVRAKAAAELAATLPGKPDALTGVIALLKNKDSAVRRGAVRLLGDVCAASDGGLRGRRRPRKEVRRALEWLAAHQEDDGRWDCDRHGGRMRYDVGVTGLALLAFLGTGDTDSPPVRKGLAFLMKSQARDGCVGMRGFARSPSNHAVAALALCEAWILTWDPRYRAAAQRATDFIARSKHPDWGWGYSGPRQAPDMETTGWMLFALRLADLGGLKVYPEPVRAGWDMLDRMTDKSFGTCAYVNQGGGCATYGWHRTGTGGLFERDQPARVSPRPWSRAGLEIDRERFPPRKTRSMTAVGAWCRVLLGAGDDEVVARALRRCVETPPAWDPKAGSIDMYYWYFGALAVCQAHGGTHPWMKSLTAAALKGQREDGSWNPIGTWGHAGGRVYATAILALCLEAPTLYAPNLLERSVTPRPLRGALAAVRRALKDEDSTVRDAAQAALARLERNWSGLRPR